MNQEQSENGDWITPLAVGLHAIAWAGLCWGLYYYMPWYKKIFEDFGVELPGNG